ncbi:MAG: ATP synthase F1 subunit delta [Bacteroidales bacterium]|nr:ATP synthase F1 subunit delta [Bacteroidales bacterium]
MNEGKISVRYSKALFQSAIEKNILDKVSRDMVLISDICTISEVKELLDSPIIRPSVKTKLLHNILEKNLEKITMLLIDLVVQNGRERFLPAIARVFRNDTLKHNGITECLLTTAVKVDADIIKQISGLIASAFNTKVELNENIDSEIIGGFILRVDDNYIDASIRNKLRKIKKELIGRSI